MWICVLPGERRGQGVLSSASTALGFDGRPASSIDVSKRKTVIKNARKYEEAHQHLCIFC